MVIYRPPPSTKNKLTITKFFSEFTKLTEDLTNCHSPLLTTGDFNFHLDNDDNADARNFMDFLESANMTQHVTGSTHSKAHTLDLIITRSDENLVHDIILPGLFSDHKVVTCKLDSPKPPAFKIYVTYRLTKSLTADALEYFGFSKLTLCWFRSFVENRRKSIIFGDEVSTPCALRYGIPQGSVLGPLLFTLYIAPLQDIIARHNLSSFLCR